MTEERPKSCLYWVALFMPDVVSGERINVGVVVASDDKVLVRGLKDWTRFNNFVRSQGMSSYCNNMLGDISTMSVEKLHTFILSKRRNQYAQLVFTEQRPSLMSPERTLEEMAKLFLVG